MNDESTELAELLKKDEHPNFDFGLLSARGHRGVREQNPAVTNVNYWFLGSYRDDDLLPKEGGQFIGRSQHVKHLHLALPDLGDASGLIPFFKGLALNRSLRSLKFAFYRDAGEIDSDALFEPLLPFFENNINLNRVEFYYNDSRWISRYLIQALSSSTSLKQVAVQKPDREQNTTHAEEQLIQGLCRNSHLHRLCLDGNLLSEDDLSAAFYDPECSLKSIEVNGDMYQNATQVRSVSTGNLQHIAWGGRIPDSLFKLRSHNFTLKKLDLSWRYHTHRGSNGCERMRRHIIGKNLAEALKHFCALRCLDLSGRSFQHGSLKTIIGLLLRPESMLEELYLNGVEGFDDESLGVSGDRLFMAHNSTLKSLSLRSSVSISSCDWKVFFSKLKDNDCHLEHIGLCNNSSINDEVVRELLRLFKAGTKIKSFDLSDHGCSYISQTGWNSLANAVSRTEVEKFTYYYHELRYATELPNVLNQVIANGCLKELILSYVPVNLTGTVLELLNGASCRLESLRFRCYIHSQQQLEQALSWVGLLQNNTTLKKLCIEFWLLDNYSREFIWDEFPSILCRDDSDSIEATYHSNHTLSSLNLTFKSGGDVLIQDYAMDKMPLELYYLLHLNRNPNKAAVARRKVMNVHFSGPSSATRLVDLNLEWRVLPQLLSWIGREKERQDLSLMFGFLLKMPALLERETAAPSSPDRKRTKMTNYH